MKIIVALDSFKGNFSAPEACSIVSESILKIIPECEIIQIPMADGGEGTTEALISSCHGTLVNLENISGPMPGQKITGSYGVLPDVNEIIVEMAIASGLPLVSQNMRNPMLASTYGTGQIIKEACKSSPKAVLLTLGGSATNDGGTGAAAALGWKFLDKNGNILPGNGESLLKIADIIPPAELNLPKVIALCDVTNPLYGPNGAAYVYAPQKYATEEMVKLLDEGLQNLAANVKNSLGLDIADIPGAGAAGGFGGGAIAFMNATLASGIETVMDTCNLDKHLNGADWIITGEGRFDNQSLSGKVAFGIKNKANKNNVKTGIIAGSLQLSEQEWRKAGIALAQTCTPDGMTDKEAIAQGKKLLAESTEDFARQIIR